MPDDFIMLQHSFWYSSIRNETETTRLIFLAMRALANSKGLVIATADAIAGFAATSIENVKIALDRLQQPDPDSTSADDDGARIVCLKPNTYHVVNYAVYKKKARDRGDYMKEYMQKKRAKERDTSPVVGSKPPAVNMNVNVSQPLAALALEEKRREENTITPEKPPKGKVKRGTYGPEFELFKAAYPKRDGDYEWKEAADRFAKFVNQGVSPETIIAGAKRYAALMERNGKIGTSFVKQASRFMSSEVWRESLADADTGKAPEPKEGRDFWFKAVDVFEDGEPVPESFSRAKFHGVITSRRDKCLIREGQRTNEPFSLGEWLESQGFTGENP